MPTPTPEVEEIVDVELKNLIFSGLSIHQIEKIPKWLLKNIEANKPEFITSLTQKHKEDIEKAREEERERIFQLLIGDNGFFFEEDDCRRFLTPTKTDNQ